MQPDFPADVVSKYKGHPVVLAKSVITTTGVDVAKRPPPPMTAEEEALSKIMKQIAPAQTALRGALDKTDMAVAKRTPTCSSRRSSRPKRSLETEGQARSDQVRGGSAPAVGSDRRPRSRPATGTKRKRTPAHSASSAPGATARSATGWTTGRSGSKPAAAVDLQRRATSAEPPGRAVARPLRRGRSRDPRSVSRPHARRLSGGRRTRASDPARPAFQGAPRSPTVSSIGGATTAPPRSPALGVKRGDRVALLLPNCPQFSIAQFGAWKLGAIVVPLNPTYTEHELEGPLVESGIETIVTLSRFYERVKRVQKRTKLRRVISTNIKEYFPPLLRLLFTLFREKRDGDRVTLAPGDHDFAHLLLVNRGHRPPAVTAGTADPAVLLMSGGTTGTPKSVLGTHGAYVIAATQIKTWNAAALRGSDDVNFLPLPLFHVYGNVGAQSLAIVRRARSRSSPTRAISTICWRRSRR